MATIHRTIELGPGLTHGCLVEMDVSPSDPNNKAGVVWSANGWLSVHWANATRIAKTDGREQTESEFGCNAALCYALYV